MSQRLKSVMLGQNRKTATSPKKNARRFLSKKLVVIVDFSDCALPVTLVLKRRRSSICGQNLKTEILPKKRVQERDLGYWSTKEHSGIVLTRNLGAAEVEASDLLAESENRNIA